MSKREANASSRSRGARRPGCAANVSLRRQRAQGRPGAHRTHGPRATKKHAAEPQVGGSSGLPCAMVLRLIRDLPGDHAWLPPSPREMSPERLSACIGAPGPHDFAVRRHVARRADIACVHRIPRSTSVTIAKRPSCRGGTRSNNHNFGKNEIEIISRWDWTIPIGLIRLANFVFRRRRFSRLLTFTNNATCRKSN
jgi:hypothetical protein